MDEWWNIYSQSSWETGLRGVTACGEERREGKKRGQVGEFDPLGITCARESERVRRYLSWLEGCGLVRLADFFYDTRFPPFFPPPFLLR